MPWRTARSATVAMPARLALAYLLGALLAEGADQVVEDQAVEHGQLGRGVAGHAGRHPPGLDHHHPPAVGLEQGGGGEPGDAGADDDHVGLQVAVLLVEPGALLAWCPPRATDWSRSQAAHGSGDYPGASSWAN